MDRCELIDYLIDEEAITPSQADNYDNYTLLSKALRYNGIVGYTEDIKDWAEPYFQKHYSEHPDELNIDPGYIQRTYHKLVNLGIIQELS